MTLRKQPPLPLDEILARLNALADPVNVAGQQRFGICAAGQLGVAIPQVRALARGRQRGAPGALRRAAS